MAIPMMNLIPQNQMLPGVYGQNTAQQTIAQNLANQHARITNTYLPKTYQDQIAQAHAQLPLTQASTAHMQETTKLQPLSAMVMAQNSMNMQRRMSQMGQRFGKAYQLVKSVNAMPKASKAAWMADNKQAWANNLADIANQNSHNAPEMNLLTPGVFRSAGINVGSQPQQVPTQQPQQLPVAQSAPSSIGGSQISSPITPQSLFNIFPTDVHSARLGIPSPTQAQAIASHAENGFSSSAKVANDIGRAAEISGNNDLIPNSTKKRNAASNTLESFLNNKGVQNLLEQTSKYQGKMGKAHEEYDKYFNPDQYAKTVGSFKQQFLPLAGGSLKIMEGLGSTIPGLNAGLHYMKLAQTSLASDPSAAMDSFRHGMNLLKIEADAIHNTAHPLFNVSNVRKYPATSGSLRSVNQSAGSNQNSASRVVVMDSKGKKWTIPASQLNDAATQGYRRVNG